MENFTVTTKLPFSEHSQCYVEFVLINDLVYFLFDLALVPKGLDQNMITQHLA